MNIKCIYISLVLISLNLAQSMGQTDSDPPASPVLNLVSVRPETGQTDLLWTKSISSDVAGYVLYYYRNGEGFAFDTIYDPLAVSYTNPGSFAEFRIESYVIAAIDNAGNVSPLSNEQHTIFPVSRLDTCNKKITITWNSYSSKPFKVTGYHIFVSKDGAPFSDEAIVPAGSTSYSKTQFTSGSNYCFYIVAELEGGVMSYSSKTCLKASMQRPPEWINADYATINKTNEIELSFTIDPFSEIKTFAIERKSETDPDFNRISVKEFSGEKILYTDREADPTRIHQYRLTAVNNCGNPVVYSNISGNIILKISSVNDNLLLEWNSYPGWRGGIDHYMLFISTGNGFTGKTVLQPADTNYTIEYSDIMYDITGSEACFYVAAYEKTNVYNISGESNSNSVCSDIIERITVPTAFTPDNDLINDFFKPVLSFTPGSYKLIISDRKNNIMFESTDYLSVWDGTRGGSTLPQGVYIWFLKVTAPSGKIYTKSGTVTIIKNR